MNPYAPVARNQFRARVSTIVEAPVLSEVEVRLADGQVITATISTREIDEMNLRVGGSVVAFLKANDVSIALV
jgi:molybdate transport system regulatory protein